MRSLREAAAARAGGARRPTGAEEGEGRMSRPDAGEVSSSPARSITRGRCRLLKSSRVRRCFRAVQTSAPARTIGGAMNFRASAIALVLAFFCGCKSPPSRILPEPASEPGKPAPGNPASRNPAPETRATLVGQTLIYPCRWGRADELAVTLEPYLVSRYGSGVRVVPQTQTNSLLIYVPSHREREMDRSRRAGSAASTVR